MTTINESGCEFEKVDFDVQSVGIFTIKGRTRLNLVGIDVIKQCAAAFTEHARDEELRCAIFQGVSDMAFIGGADLKELRDLNVDNAADFVGAIHELSNAIRQFPVPVIARLCGYCLGGGLEVAAACDFRICDGSAMFGMPEVQVGVPSVVEAALLPQLIGWGKTRELVLRGNIIDAKEAVRIGLVEHRVGDVDDAIVQAVMDIVRAAPGAIRLQKKLCLEWEGDSWDRAIQAGLPAFTAAYRTDEPQSYIQRFFDEAKHSK